MLTSGSTCFGGVGYCFEFGAVLNPPYMLTAADSLSQLLQLVPNVQYQLSFFWSVNGAGPNEFQVSLLWPGNPNATVLLDFVDEAAHDYIQYHLNFVASASNVTLIFSGFNNPAYGYLDNIVLSNGTSNPLLLNSSLY